MRKKSIRHILLYIVLIITVILVGGCNCLSPEAERIENIPDAYTKVMVESRESTGMQKAWIDYAAIPAYNKVILNVQLSENMIANTTMDNLTTWRLVSDEAEDNKYVEDYAKESFNRAFLMNNKDFALTVTPAEHTLLVNIYLTQIIPGDGVVGSISNFPLTPISLIIKPIGMVIHGSSGSSGGAVAMEAIILDSLSHKILAVFSSREKSATAIINFDEFGTFGAVRSIIDIWANNLATTLNKIKEKQENLKAENNMKGLTLINF